MSIGLEEIKEGHCYQKPSKQGRREQCRRVVKIDDDSVIYESWGGGVGNSAGHLRRVTVAKTKFAEDVEKEIPCPKDIRPLAEVKAEIDKRQ